MKTFFISLAAIALSAPVVAQDLSISGDAEAGERLFGRQCIACHVVRDESGEVLAGRNARTGPNLYQLPGRMLAAEEGFRYGTGLLAAGEAGLIWDEANFVSYVQDPTGWVREALEDNSLRAKMAFRVRNEQDALDMYAYIASLGANAADQ